jgi:trehalose-6-phosphate synthase
VVSSICALIWAIRAWISFFFPAPLTIVVFSFSIITFLARPSILMVTFSSLMPRSAETMVPAVRIAISSSIAFRRSLCEYDLVGFQTGDDAFNFSRYLRRECGLHSHDFNFVLADRTIRIDVFPVGIETAALEQEIGSAAGRINGAYGEADWTPIRYINRAYSHSTLAGLYRAARVGLVTPLLTV